jgi:hypothetical protein
MNVLEDYAASNFRVEHIIREVTEIEFHPHNMNREEGFCLSKP